MDDFQAAILISTLAPRIGSSIAPAVRKQALLDLRAHLAVADPPAFIPEWLKREFAMLPPQEAALQP